MSSQVLPKPLLLGNEAVRISPLRVSVPTEARSRGLSSAVNSQVCVRNKPLWLDPQIRSAALERSASQIYRVT